jgi:hypothetical protein
VVIRGGDKFGAAVAGDVEVGDAVVGFGIRLAGDEVKFRFREDGFSGQGRNPSTF